MVLQKWKTDFEGLYQMNQTYTSKTTEFSNNLNQMSQRWEHAFSEIHEQGPRTSDENEAGRIRRANEMLNRPKTLQETTNILKRTRNGEAVGVANVSNEIIKIPLLQDCLHELFQKYFEYNVIPRLWYKALMHTILKRKISITTTSSPRYKPHVDNMQSIQLDPEQSGNALCRDRWHTSRWTKLL